MGGCQRRLNELLNNKFGVETTLLDASDPASVEAAIRLNTKLIHIETREFHIVKDITHA